MVRWSWIRERTMPARPAVPPSPVNPSMVEGSSSIAIVRILGAWGGLAGWGAVAAPEGAGGAARHALRARLAATASVGSQAIRRIAPSLYARSARRGHLE